MTTPNEQRARELAASLTDAAALDEEGDGIDVAAGLYGTHTTEWLRRTARALSHAAAVEGVVLIERRDAHALAEWAKATAKPDGRSGVPWISAKRVADLLTTPQPAPAAVAGGECLHDWVTDGVHETECCRCGALAAQPAAGDGMPLLQAWHLDWKTDVCNAPRDLPVICVNRDGKVWIGFYDERGAWWGSHPERYAEVPADVVRILATPAAQRPGAGDDTARLNWIDSQVQCYGDGYTEPREAGWCVQWQQSKPGEYWTNLRDWVDAEMRRTDDVTAALRPESGE